MNIKVLWDGGVASALGFAAGGARGGIKMSGEDVGLIVAPNGTTAAGVWTQNAVKAAPVWVSAEHISPGETRGIVWNSGNANCCTGAQGLIDARRMCELAASKIGCDPTQILVCSTGIIGQPLPMEKIESALSDLQSGHGDQFSAACARAAMTTDTVPKHLAAQGEINGQTVTVGGQVKGVGMIGPDMAAMSPQSTLHATLLAFLTTDARAEKALLQRVLESAVAKSFNSVTVDGDTSTNDSAILLAGGSGQNIDQSTLASFQELVDFVCIELAKKVARDGEGATKLVTIEVEGAKSEADAQKVALTIANSPLVKTAIFGRDPNWGRIAMAAGRSGVSFDARYLAIWLGAIEVFRAGEPIAFDQIQAEAAMSEENLTVKVLLSEGSARWTAWTCDFSYDYVKINAEYHT